MVYPQEVINENGTEITISDGDFFGRNHGEQMQIQFVEAEVGDEHYINLNRDQVGTFVDALMNWLNREGK